MTSKACDETAVFGKICVVVRERTVLPYSHKVRAYVWSTYAATWHIGLRGKSKRSRCGLDHVDELASFSTTDSFPAAEDNYFLFIMLLLQ